MKRISWYYCLFLVLVFDGYGQEHKLYQINLTVEYDSLNNNRNLTNDGIGHAPIYEAGVSEIEKYFLSNIKYSKSVYKTGLFGKNYLSVTVGEDGEIKRASFVKASVPERVLDQLEKLILRCDNWYPARKEGNAIETNILLIITFESVQS